MKGDDMMAYSSAQQEVLAFEERFYETLRNIRADNGAALLALWSTADDVSTMNGAGGTERGFAAVKERWEWWAENGPIVPNNAREYLAVFAAPELSQTVFIEHTPNYDMRITHTYRREGGEWRMVHRHADTLGERKQP